MVEIVICGDGHDAHHDAITHHGLLAASRAGIGAKASPASACFAIASLHSPRAPQCAAPRRTPNGPTD
jgi:hypothetical protein